MAQPRLKAPPGLVVLAAQLREAKTTEDGAKQSRIRIEGEIISLLDFAKTEGQETYEGETAAGSCATVVLKQPISTSFNGDGWAKLRSECSARARKAVVTKYTLDTKLARALQEDGTDRASWLKIASLITRKPGKVSVDLKVISIASGDPLDALESASATNAVDEADA